MRVRADISSMLIPLFIASNTLKSRRSSGTLSRSASGISEIGAALIVSRDISAPRTAFISAASKEGAIAMTSPVAFI